MVRLVLLNTSYTAAQIYHDDTGLTLTQLRHLVAGVEERRQQAMADQLSLWANVAPLLGLAANFGFSGNPDPLMAAAGRYRSAAKQIGAPKRPAKAPKPKPSNPIFSHPLFVTNLGKALT